MKKLNILQVSSRADMGGGPQHIFNLISLMNQFNFYVAAPSAGEFFDRFSKYSAGYLELPYRKFSILSLISLILAVKKWDIDIIHSHGRGAGVYSRIAGLFTKVTIIHTHHGIFFEKNIIKKNIQIAIEYLFNNLTNHTIFVSLSEYKNYQKNLPLFNVDFSIVPNGVPIPESITKKIKLEITNLISVTRLESEKGNNFLLLLMALLLKKNTNLNLKIVGDGPLRVDLEKLAHKLNIEKYVEFLGVRMDIPSLLEASDIFISCSLAEAQGMAVIEAMSYQLPVVVSNVAGHVDSVESGKNGLLFNLNELNEGADLIHKLISNRELADTLSINARKNIIQNFSINSMINSMNNIYCNVSKTNQ